MALDRLTNITRSGLGSVHSYDVAGVVAVGVITASSFSGNITGNITGNIVGDVTGNVTGNVTGTATTATNLANAANITTGTISNDRLPATITKNLTGNVTGNADTASNLTGSPNITVTDIIASGNVSVGGTLTYEDVTNIDSVGVVTARAGVKIPDNQKIQLGTGNDLEIYHDGSNSVIKDNGTGKLILDTDGTAIEFQKQGLETIATFNSDGAIELYYDNAKKFETHSAGVVISGNLQLNDNNHAYFGDSQDLEIRHDGFHSYIKNNTGNLYFQHGNENMLQLTSDGNVELYYDNSKKFETTNTGATVTGTLVSELDLNAISSSISDTAVDVFVYDTRKDSDGGAWRKRTQHTSWYNETLGTATRGSRKEFPAVAVIVATSSKVTIYDGDDPDLPMWMVFNTTSGNLIGAGALRGVTALNGIIVTPAAGYTMETRFISDYSLDWFASQLYEYKGNIEQRNDTLGFRLIESYGLVSSASNDVAMAVLPNAPIDDSTGLPIPTIAVATDRGVSIIKDNGSVANLEHDGGTHETCRSIAFSEDKTKVLFTSDYNDDPTYNRRVIVEDIPSGDSTFTVVQDDSYQIAVGGYDNNGPRILGTSNGSSAVGGIDHLLSQAAATSEGVTLLDNELDNILKSKIAYVTAEYNTGWMVGDIKGAFLSDTDTTNLTGGNKVTNGDSWSGAQSSQSSTAPTGWTGGNGATFKTETGNGANGTYIRLYNADSGNGGPNSYMSHAITTVPGKKYKISVTQIHHATFSVFFRAGTQETYSDLVQNSWTSSSSNTPRYEQNTFTATGTTTYITLGIVSGTNNYSVGWDDVVVTEVDEDRSVNANGLHSFGTVTKSAVATGADLVSYGPFSTSNRLRQTYNSDLNFGTNDFSIIFWMYNTGSTVHQTLVGRDNREFSVDILDNANYNRKFRIYGYNSGNSMGSFDSNADPFPLNTWSHVCVNYTGGNTVAVYVNGVFNKSGSLDYDINDSSNGLNIGCRNTSGSYAHAADATKLALVRISKSAPTPEQIKKMYEDEKVLFQENAKATLYGSSDAVTALGYDEDTELLHVGTSAGRSDFQGLRRINNTTTAVTTAISASDELIAEQ